MAYNSSKLQVVLLVCFIASSTMISTARKLDLESTFLKSDNEGPASCWEVLLELQSCSSEVVMFFLNGETHLGANCCKAISTIQRHCWPSMLGSIGVTKEESDILRGYCDAIAEGNEDGSSSTPPPESADQGYNNSHY